MSFGFIMGRFFLGCMFIIWVFVSGVCILNFVGVSVMGVGVVISLRVGVRMGMYFVGGWRIWIVMNEGKVNVY